MDSMIVQISEKKMIKLHVFIKIYKKTYDDL